MKLGKYNRLVILNFNTKLLVHQVTMICMGSLLVLALVKLNIMLKINYFPISNNANIVIFISTN